MELLAVLVLLHLLYDFHWQGDFIAKGKASSLFLLTVHAATWALIIWAGLYFFGAATWPKLGYLLGTHWIVDLWKVRYAPTSSWALWVDQAVHVATIVVVVLS